VLRVAVVLLLLATPAVAGPAQDSLAAARDLYTTADYREALAMLTRLRPVATVPDDVRAIEQYRAFALIALGRDAEAELVVEGIAQRDPTWTLPAGEASPRIATLFAQARERALPGVLRQRLAAARALYSEKSYDAAAEAFTGVLLLLEDPAMARAAGGDAQSISALATGFRDLALAAGEQARAAAARQAPSEPAGQIAATVPPASEAAGPTAGPSPAPAPAGVPTGTPETPAPDPAVAPEPSAEPTAPPVGSTDIVPPVAIAQAIPRASDATVPLGGPQTILLDIVIDETGRVERAQVRRSVNRLYEAELVAATRGWRYTPATQGGRPVKYERTLEVTLNPRD
jgi:TonB family protein